MTKVFTGKYVAQVNLDKRDRYGEQRVTERNAGMRERPGIQQDEVGAVRRRSLDAIDYLVLGIALECLERMPEIRSKIAEHGWDNVAVFDRLPNEHDRYDLVVCSSVCAFVDDYPGLLRELAASLRPGGLFVQWDWELDPDADEPYGLTREAMRSALLKADLEVIVVETGFELPMGELVMRPLMGVGRRS